MAADLKTCAAYEAHAELLDRCVEIAQTWRSRFWDRKALWGRIRRGRRLAKELAEVAPVLARVLHEVESTTIAEGQPRLVILDLCSGFGYLGMFLSELLPTEKVERIVLVDKMWAPQNVSRKPHHIDPAHVDDPSWPVRLTTCRTDLKVPSDRRSLAKHFLSHGAPAMLLGVHLCGTLSLRCIDLYNDCPGIGFLALKPCCLPDLLFAKRGEIFGREGGHCFPAKAVCAAGKWNKGVWVNGASKDELERKFGSWVTNLSLCVDCDEGEGEGEGEAEGGGGGGAAASLAAAAAVATRGVRVERHVVQPKWFLNDFIFARRAWSAQPPYSSSYQHAAAAAEAGGVVSEDAPQLNVRMPNTSNSSGVSEARRKEMLEEWLAGRREEKRVRRLGNKSDAQRLEAEAKDAARNSKPPPLRFKVEPLGSTTVGTSLWLEVHHDSFVRLGGTERRKCV